MTKNYRLLVFCLLVFGAAALLPRGASAQAIQQNPLRGGTVTWTASNGSCYEYYPRAYLTDGTSNFFYLSNCVNGQAVITVDVGSNVSLTGVELFPVDQGSASSSVSILGSLDGSSYDVLASGFDYRFGASTANFGSVKTYRYWRIAVASGSYSGGEFAIVEFQGIAGSTPTPTPTPTNVPTNTPTPTPTNTPTPTITLTPTNTPVPSATSINVQGVCGGPGQVPCHIYWLTPGPVIVQNTVVVQVQGTVQVEVQNWPTVPPTNTPIGGVNRASTVIAIAASPNEAVEPVPGSAGGTSSVVVAGYTLLSLQETDFGCPIDLGIFDTHFCLLYKEVATINIGTVPIPTWPFTVALFAVVVTAVRKR